MVASPGGKRGWPWGFWRSLLAIVVGNVVYAFVEDILPPGARHEPFRMDWGLLVDLWLCVAFYGLSLWIWPRKES